MEGDKSGKDEKDEGRGEDEERMDKGTGKARKGGKGKKE
jgi:hypothetical protein